MANAHAEHHDNNAYYVPHGSKWPVFASVALFVTMVGFATWLNEVSWGKTTFYVGLAALLFRPDPGTQRGAAADRPGAVGALAGKWPAGDPRRGDGLAPGLDHAE